MKAYLDIVRKILDEGVLKQNRTGVAALTIPFVHFEHDMGKDGFPLLTSKKMAYKSMAVELEGFLKGITSKQWFKDRGCHFWDFWANPNKIPEYVDDDHEFIPRHQSDCISSDEIDEGLKIGYLRYTSLAEKKKYQEQEDDLGPLGYSWQWRRFGEACDENDGGILKGADQLAIVVKRLIENPSDRRMVVSAWCPNQLDSMALPPCHVLWFVTVINNTLNLCWVQRSVDTMIGLPHNIASYALLLKLLAKYANMSEGKLSGFLCDTHIYENHVEGAREQLRRPTHPLPQLNILNPTPFSFSANDATGVLNVNFDALCDIQLVNYVHEPPIKFEIAI